MLDILREATVGGLLNRVSGGRILPFPDQIPGFAIPEHYLIDPKTTPSSPSTPAALTRAGSSDTLYNKPEPTTDVKCPEKPPHTMDENVTALVISKFDAARQTESMLEGGSQKVIDKGGINTEGYIVVDWYGDDDPENPRNWSFPKRCFVLAQIVLLTFSVYIGSAIYTAATSLVMAEFHVSEVVATLGLSLFIEGYAIGPMILSPLQELPSIGRNPPYIITLTLFALLQIPAALSNNITSLLVFRFLIGFLGSPALATGGASVGDIFPERQIPLALGLWAMGATGGPVLGPIVGGFAATAKGWRWPLWELSWISGFTAVFLSLFFPETLPDKILLKRAQRLRKLTGNENLRSMSEIRQAKMTPRAVAAEYLIRPFQLMREPVLIFLNLYLGLAYAIFYLWFEAFPLVFGDIYHFHGGIAGLPFLGILVGAMVSYVGYAIYLQYYLYARFDRIEGQGKRVQQEEWLHLGLFAGSMIPISLLTFGWTARPDGSVHWIFPIIGAGLYMPGIYLLFQSVLVYLPAAYPDYVASVLAGNTLVRSSVAATFPLFGQLYFKALGVAPGCSLLAGVAALMVPVLLMLYRYGGRLRNMSRYAEAQL
ncbi:MFS general substrate transporter [Clavulina sp. PMI_390]|nr:MFS general substrate transporter [Clavulina sp. PMI_390]